MSYRQYFSSDSHEFSPLPKTRTYIANDWWRKAGGGGWDVCVGEGTHTHTRARADWGGERGGRGADRGRHTRKTNTHEQIRPSAEQNKKEFWNNMYQKNETETTELVVQLHCKHPLQHNLFCAAQDVYENTKRLFALRLLHRAPPVHFTTVRPTHSLPEHSHTYTTICPQWNFQFDTITTHSSRAPKKKMMYMRRSGRKALSAFFMSTLSRWHIILCPAWWSRLEPPGGDVAVWPSRNSFFKLHTIL